MARSTFLMYALAGIVLINIIAIVLLNNRLADEQAREAADIPSSTVGAGDTGAPSPTAPERPVRAVIRTQPLVRVVTIGAPDDCPDCFDIARYITALNETVNLQSERGAGFPFLPPRLPAIAFNQTFEEYPALLEGWADVGNITNVTGTGRYDGTWYVLPTAHPPYFDTVEGRTRGMVTVTYITAESCDECYDPYSLREFINASRIVVGDERSFDIASPEGRATASRYNITRVPTMIMDAEAGLYPNLLPGWLVVGTVEPDGAHVLRNLERLQVTYYDLPSKRVMNP